MTIIIILSELVLAFPAIVGAIILNRKFYSAIKKLLHGKLLFVGMVGLLAFEVSFVTAIQHLDFWYYLGLDSCVYVGLVAIGANKLYRIAQILGRELV